MRFPLALMLIGALCLAAGCGVVRDMRDEYLANRALRDAVAELAAQAPRRAVALNHLDLAYRLRTDDRRFLARLAGPYLMAGDYDRALRCYQAAADVTNTPQDLGIGMCYLKLGRTDEGVEQLERALEDAARGFRAGAISPLAYAGVLNDAGYALVDANVRVEGAFEMVREAVRISPEMPAYIDSLGWAYFRRGDYTNAAFHLERAARLAGREDAEILWHLGAVHVETGQIRRAEYELARALALDPANEEARKSLERLRRRLPQPGWYAQSGGRSG